MASSRLAWVRVKRDKKEKKVTGLALPLSGQNSPSCINRVPFQHHRNQIGRHTAAIPRLGNRQKEQECKAILGCIQLKASLGYMRLSQKRICKYLRDPPILFSMMAAIAPPWTVCELYCKGLPGGASKAEEVPSPARLCSPQAIPASPLSSPTPTSVQYALPVGSPGTVLSLQPLVSYP